MDAHTTPWLAMSLNNAWANATLYSAIQLMPNEALTAERPGFFSTLSRTLNHIYEVDLYYLDALENGGKGRSVFDRTEVTDVSELARLQLEADIRFATFCGRLDDAKLAETRTTERDTGPVDEVVAALVLHLVQHQIHHRGQAHVQMSHAGVSPPQLDDFYLTHGRVPTAAAYWS
ncbi:MAG: nuclease [Boseongicola sp.]|nr:nuclease [Boseongicola sp.]